MLNLVLGTVAMCFCVGLIVGLVYNAYKEGDNK